MEPCLGPHEVSDDLESFFWVLLYQIAKCRNVQKLDLSKEMQDVFDQHSGLDRDGIVRGGSGKLICLADYLLGGLTIDLLVTTPCKDIINDLRSLFNDLYLHVRVMTTQDSDFQSMIEALREKDPRVKEARERLRSSEWVLALINRHLDSKWDVDDDGSLHKTVLRPDPSASRSRRKRKASDSDETMTFNQRRKGRLPPSSTKRSRNSHSLQGNRAVFTSTTTGRGSVRRSQRMKGRSGAIPSGSSKLRKGNGL